MLPSLRGLVAPVRLQSKRIWAGRSQESAKIAMLDRLLWDNGSQFSKYQRWYDELMQKARTREIPIAYTEMHHVLPRSLGGSDDEHNLVRLTFREHFIAHWLLTKCLSGRDLRKMQFALHAMTMCGSSGLRIVAGWQFEVAKRAWITEEMIERAEARARAEYIDRNHQSVIEAQQSKLRAAVEFMQLPMRPESRWSPLVELPIKARLVIARGRAEISQEDKHKRKRSRPSKRARARRRAERAEQSAVSLT